jgi:hypothetical protein
MTEARRKKAENESRYRQLLEKDHLTPAEEDEYEAICMAMLKKGNSDKERS